MSYPSKRVSHNSYLTHGYSKSNYDPRQQLAYHSSTANSNVHASAQDRSGLSNHPGGQTNKNISSQQFLRKKSANKSKQSSGKPSMVVQSYISPPHQDTMNYHNPLNQLTQSSNSNLRNNQSYTNDMATSTLGTQQNVVLNSPQYSVSGKPGNHADQPGMPGGPLLIQAPNFMKVKSKTNANPTRQNSPRFQAMLSPQNGSSQPIRGNNNSKVQKNSMNYQKYNNSNAVDGDTPPLMNKGAIGITSQIAGEMMIDTNDLKQGARAQAKATVGHFRQNVFSMPNSPSKIEEMSQGQQKQSQMYKSHQNKDFTAKQVRQSFDKKAIQSQKGEKKGRSKVSSTQNIRFANEVSKKPSYQDQVSVTESNSRLPSGKDSHQRKVNSLKQMQNGQSSSQNGGGKVSNLPGTTISQNRVTYASQQQFGHQTVGNIQNQANQMISQMDQQQKKYLNMAVSKNIGGIASGKQRRENRNQLMKNYQNQNQGPESKSLVGSMGSVGSIGLFMGVQDPQAIMTNQTEVTNEGHKSLKFSIDRPNINKTNDNIGQRAQPTHSQMQQKHVTSMNPMFFQTGEAAVHQHNYQINRANPYMTANGQQNKQPTIYSNQQPKHGMVNSKVGSPQADQTHTGIGQIGPTSSNIHHRGKKNQSQTYQNMMQMQMNIQGSGEQFKNIQTLNSFYDMNRQGFNHNQTTGDSIGSQKPQIIQKRKINPISKTSVNNSKNPSIERGTKQSIQSSNQVSTKYHVISNKQGSIQYQMKNGQIIGPQKAFANTAKVSYNNSPKSNRIQGLNGAGLVYTNQQLRQQPIGQPAGDMPPLNNDTDFVKLCQQDSNKRQTFRK